MFSAVEADSRAHESVNSITKIKKHNTIRTNLSNLRLPDKKAANREVVAKSAAAKKAADDKLRKGTAKALGDCALDE